MEVLVWTGCSWEGIDHSCLMYFQGTLDYTTTQTWRIVLNTVPIGSVLDGVKTSYESGFIHVPCPGGERLRQCSKWSLFG